MAETESETELEAGDPAPDFELRGTDGETHGLCDFADYEALLRETTEEYLEETMAREVERFRRQLAETPVELEVQDRPSVNVKQEESWVELRVRYLVSPKRAQRVRNDLYERVLAAFNEHPERVKSPVSRNR